MMQAGRPGARAEQWSGGDWRRGALGVIVALALWSGGCGTTRLAPEGELTISSEFSAEEQAQIIAAADEWHTATASLVNLKIRIADQRDSGALVIRRSLDTDTLGEFVLSPGAEPLIRLDPDQIGVSRIPYVAAHELAHVMGVDHDSLSYLMQPYAPRNAVGCIDQRALDRLCVEVLCADGVAATCSAQLSEVVAHR